MRRGVHVPAGTASSPILTSSAASAIDEHGLEPPLHRVLPWWITLCVLAAAAWTLTVVHARGMGSATGTMGLSIGAFLVLWVVMMAAMMLPSMAPAVGVWVTSASSRPTHLTRAVGVAGFLSGYLLAWAAFGVLVYPMLTGFDRFVATSTGRYLGIGVLLLAGVYQVTPLKRACLTHCRAPIGTDRGDRTQGPARAIWVGVSHGVFCMGSCGGLMLILVALGAMNVAAMAVLAAVIAIEKIWRFGRPFAVAVGITLIAVAALALFVPRSLPGLQQAPRAPARMPATMPSMDM
ncbi:MAG TPA: DUF2182 domain-containing protein [Actinomycetota bacterium]|nr:DUF2182 domain-containing protein [Actinomycetota bacterium]